MQHVVTLSISERQAESLCLTEVNQVFQTCWWSTYWVMSYCYPVIMWKTLFNSPGITYYLCLLSSYCFINIGCLLWKLHVCSDKCQLLDVSERSCRAVLWVNWSCCCPNAILLPLRPHNSLRCSSVSVILLSLTHIAFNVSCLKLLYRECYCLPKHSL